MTGLVEFRGVDHVEEALAVLAELGSDARILAGGTDVMIQIQRGELDPSTLLHIERVGDLGNVDVNGRLSVGALATHLELGRNPVLADRYTAISHAASLVGGWQTQAVGTIGGNVCNASPAADLLPPLLVHDAIVRLASRDRGQREVPLHEFVVGRRAVAREPDELVTGFSLDPVGKGTADAYRKVGRRGAMEVAIAGLAVRLSVDDEASVQDARVAVCSVGPVPFRARAAEECLIGSVIDPDRVATASSLLVEQSEPIDDARATARYRSMLLPRLFESVVTDCHSRAIGRTG